MAAIMVSTSTRQHHIYAFDSKTNGEEVTALVEHIRKAFGFEKNKVMIYVLSGTHGDSAGNLVGDGDFFQDQKLGELRAVQNVKINEHTPADTWKRYFNEKKSILILAWSGSAKWSGLKLYNN